MRLPGGFDAPCGGLAILADEHLHAGFDGDLRIDRLPGLAPHRCHEPVAHPADLLLDGTEELARADEVVPACQYLTAQQGAVGGLHADGAHGLRERPLSVGAQRLESDHLRLDGADHLRRAAGQCTDRAVEGLQDHLVAAHHVGGELAQPVPDRRNGCVRQQAVGVHPGLGDGEQRRAAQSALAHHLSQVRRHLVHGCRRHPVEHHRHDGLPLGRRAQVLPRDGIGVTRSGRDEQPQVGRGE